MYIKQVDLEAILDCQSGSGLVRRSSLYCVLFSYCKECFLFAFDTAMLGSIPTIALVKGMLVTGRVNLPSSTETLHDLIAV